MAERYYPLLAGKAQLHEMYDMLDYESGKGWKVTARLMSPFYLSEEETLIVLYDEKKHYYFLKGNQDRIHIEHPGEEPFGVITGIEMVRRFFPSETVQPEMNVYYELRD